MLLVSEFSSSFYESLYYILEAMPRVFFLRYGSEILLGSLLLIGGLTVCLPFLV